MGTDPVVEDIALKVDIGRMGVAGLEDSSRVDQEAFGQAYLVGASIQACQEEASDLAFLEAVHRIVVGTLVKEAYHSQVGQNLVVVASSQVGSIATGQPTAVAKLGFEQ